MAECLAGRAPETSDGFLGRRDNCCHSEEWRAWAGLGGRPEDPLLALRENPDKQEIISPETTGTLEGACWRGAGWVVVSGHGGGEWRGKDERDLSPHWKGSLVLHSLKGEEKGFPAALRAAERWGWSSSTLSPSSCGPSAQPAVPARLLQHPPHLNPRPVSVPRPLSPSLTPHPATPPWNHQQPS